MFKTIAGMYRALIKAINEDNKSLLLTLAIILSFLLFIWFAFSKNQDWRYLNLPEVWFAVALIPVVLALLLLGYIKSANILGVAIETALGNAKDYPNIGTENVLRAMEVTEKERISKLNQLTREQKQKISVLRFKSPYQRYQRYAVLEYLTRLGNVNFFEISRRGHKSIFLSLKAFGSFEGNSEQIREFVEAEGKLYDEYTIERFLWALRNHLVEQMYHPYVFKLRVSADEDILDILSKMYKEGSEYAAVYDPEKNFVGILSASEIERRLAKLIVKKRSKNNP